jgi:hypothetical protein
MKFLILALCIAAAVAAPTPLTTDEASLVRDTWAQVKNQEIEILYAVFKAHPDIQARFPAFVGKDLDSIKDSGKFALHATRIVSFISEIIGLIGVEGNRPAINTILAEFASNNKRRGIPKDQMVEFRGSLTDFVKAHATWGDNVEHAWEHALNNVFEIVFANIDGHHL